MRVSDVMVPAAVTDQPGECVRAVAARMWSRETGPLVVLVDGRVLGTATDRDVLSAVARGFDVDTTPLSAVLNSQPLTVGPDLPLREAAALMAQHRVQLLPVVHDGQLLGVLRQSAVLGALLAGDVDVVIDLTAVEAPPVAAEPVAGVA